MQKKLTGYRAVIERSFRERRRRNPNYSLRAFARDLGISYSYLHGVLGKRRSLSVVKARELVQTLELKESEMKVFLGSVDLEKRKIARIRSRRQTDL